MKVLICLKEQRLPIILKLAKILIIKSKTSECKNAEVLSEIYN